MSAFGGFGGLGQIFISPSGGQGQGGSAIQPGGFPGVFPGAGVSNSGWAGFFQNPLAPCTTEDVRQGRCTLGPPPALLGPRNKEA